jgi:hypothetical protein
MPLSPDPPAEWLCAEYSAALQLRVLDLDPAALPEPILDLGCGAGATLVRELRRLGKDAHGLDHAEGSEPFLHVADWLDFDLGHGRWGTVLSHMGFSNHFVHHHLRSGETAARYARRYMQVLGALRPEGLFAYAPGLPFLERLLPPERYALSRHPVSELAGTAVDRELEAALGESVLYSCQVRLRGAGFER